MRNELPVEATPIVCDMTGAPDTAEERMAEWRRLIARTYVGRELSADRVRLRFRADEGVEAWVRDLSAREKACCPFLDFSVTTAAGEVRWDVTMAEGTALDDDMTRGLLAVFHDLPDIVGKGVDGMVEQFAERGLEVSRHGTLLTVQHEAGEA